MTTPCESRGWKEGDRFNVIKDVAMVKEGAVVRLIRDDGTVSPFFQLMEGELSDLAQGFGFNEKDKLAMWLDDSLEKIGDD